MQHRGTARRRVLIASAARLCPRPAPRSSPTGAPVGTLGTVVGGTGAGDRAHRPGQGSARCRPADHGRRRAADARHPALARSSPFRRGRRRGRGLMADRAGAPPRAWQRMLSGRRLDLLDPSPLDIEISDIAHGLARVARWNGQTVGDHAFSVAQHSLLVEEIFCAVMPEASRDAAAGGAAARRARICHRRHDLAVQVGGRRRLQGGRGPAAAGDPSALRAAGRAAVRRCATPSSGPTRSPPISRRRCSPASRSPRRRAISAARAASTRRAST